ncbi:hypothetical protein DO97_02460 [Neosynechococcus sphagnicola sy1]|uniref:RNA polymerase alpha subunit C-terminal domain-containing protein n=1 Tax=Neosynechococcus sphagnicola sy1 TaxID=1497020 RepID=A0A098TM71_9CYAN|nr:DNA-directed RNA polymerase subunit alpha C-terminal domain-containing protein [Neosynechococcus sphagnicola]KGF72962.1 hypothetical protein DO97_02460 [Neosynechococcus sphagnicola sy1]
MNNPVHPLLQTTAIEALELSMQAHGFLKRSQIHTIADLLNYTQEDLRILDPSSAHEVITALHERLGIALPQAAGDLDDQMA